MSDHHHKSMAARQDKVKYHKNRQLAAAEARAQDGQRGPDDGGQDQQPLRGLGAPLARQPPAVAPAVGVENGDRAPFGLGIGHQSGIPRDLRRQPAQNATQPTVLHPPAEHDAAVTESRADGALSVVPTGRGAYNVSTAQQYTGLDSFSLDGV
jgi:hypothetical protein